MFETIRGALKGPMPVRKDLGGCLAQLAQKEAAAQLIGVSLWEKDRNPLHCSRHNGPTMFGNPMTVDSEGRPVCWTCVGMYGLAYDKRIAWNPETGQTEMIEAHPGSPVTSEAIPFGALLRPRSRF